MVALIVGAVMLVLGILGLVFWWGEFIVVLIGSLPCIFVICGLAAIAVGISSAKDKVCAAKKETEAPEVTPEEKTEPESPESSS